MLRAIQRLRFRIPRSAGMVFSPATQTIAWICLAVFLVQSVADRLVFPEGYRLGHLLSFAFGLHWPLLAKGCFWQPITYNFMHGSWLHLALNLFSLLFFGSAVEQLIGTRRFWVLFLVSGMVGGLGWMLFNWLEPTFWLSIQNLPGDIWPRLAQRWAEQQPIGAFGVCIGASAAVFGLIGAYAALCPERELLLLLFFVIPIRMKARTLAILLMIFTVIQLTVGWGQIAYAAHLVGGIAGYLLALKWRGLFIFPHAKMPVGY